MALQVKQSRSENPETTQPQPHELKRRNNHCYKCIAFSFHTDLKMKYSITLLFFLLSALVFAAPVPGLTSFGGVGNIVGTTAETAVRAAAPVTKPNRWVENAKLWYRNTFASTKKLEFHRKVEREAIRRERKRATYQANEVQKEIFEKEGKDVNGQPFQRNEYSRLNS